MKPIFLSVFVVSILAISCNRSPSNFEKGDPNGASLMKVSAKGEAVDRKLIKNGSISFETEDITATQKAITEIAKKYQGYVSDETTNHFDNRDELSFTLRLPATAFDNAIADIENHAARVDNKNINVKDVTEEFIDVEARLKTKKELETRYLALLKQAKNVEEVIAVESQLGNVRAEIESMEGRLKYLSDQVTFSTLAVTCHQPLGSSLAFFSNVSSAFVNGWDNLLKFLIGLLNLWPFIILAGLILYFVTKVRKKKATIVQTKSES